MINPPKKYEHTVSYEEHVYASTFGSGACGKCPFPAYHPIHIGVDKPVIYSWSNPNASWRLPK